MPGVFHYGHLTAGGQHPCRPMSECRCGTAIVVAMQVQNRQLRRLGPQLEAGSPDLAVATSKTFRSLARLTGAAPSMAGPRVKRTLTANGLRQLIAFISRMTAVDRAELEGVSADRAPQIVAGALVAEASMRALSIEAVEICPWALREGLILRKLDSEADGTALIESSSVHTSVRAVGGQPADRNAANRSRGSKP